MAGMRRMPKPSPTESPLLFEVDPQPLEEALTALGGIPLVVQAFRSLGLPGSVQQHVTVKERERGYDEATFVESFVILNAAGGECVDDFAHLRSDAGLAELVGHELPSPEAARKFLNAFHEEEKIAEAQQRRLPDAVAYIPEENRALEGLGRVNRDLLQRLGERCADQKILTVAQAAFAAAPKTVTSYYYRGDSACHEKKLLRWLLDEKREDGPAGFIGFAVSARMSEALHAAILEVPESGWKAYGKPEPDVDRECAEVVFVSNEELEPKGAKPLRYVAIRLRKRQGGLFADGSSVLHFAVLSNIWDWEPVKLIEWHREKAGTIERVHDVLKNELATGVLPSKYFGANAAWLRLAVISYNVLTALKRLALPADLLRARPKRLRFLIFYTAGRLVHHARQMRLRLAREAEGIVLWLEALRFLPLQT